MYLAAYATQADLECHNEDGGYDNVSDMAYPNGVILRDIEDATIQRVLQSFKDEIVLSEGQEFDETGDEGRAHLASWQPLEFDPFPGVPQTSHYWQLMAPGNQLIASAVIRNVLVFE